MRKQSYNAFLVFVIGILSVKAQETAIFSIGEKSPNVHHVGEVWLNELSAADTTFNYSIALATFKSDARLNWHKHPGGQTLLVTEGEGYYQERNKPKQIIKKGDVIKCLPNVEHWHGASPQKGIAYIAVSPSQKGKTIWMEPLTIEQYYRGTLSKMETKNEEQQVIQLSKQKWQWMADKNVDQLTSLFDDKSVFVHMGGSWGKKQEIEIIKSGGIHYKKADIHEVSVNIIGNTAILLNNITLLAVVGGNEVTNPFIVTEVYIKENDDWKLGSMSFTKLLTP
jgi:quercetin dioxygenase-like cupin family protein